MVRAHSTLYHCALHCNLTRLTNGADLDFTSIPTIHPKSSQLQLQPTSTSSLLRPTSKSSNHFPRHTRHSQPLGHTRTFRTRYLASPPTKPFAIFSHPSVCPA